MRRIVIVNSAGDILATAAHRTGGGGQTPANDGPPDYGFIPLEGQSVHVVDIPDEALAPAVVLKLHRTHRVEVINGTESVVLREKTSGVQSSTCGTAHGGAAKMPRCRTPVAQVSIAAEPPQRPLPMYSRRCASSS